MKLWEIAHSRTGDKGNISNLSLIAYDEKDYELLKEKVTPERVKEHFKGIVKGEYGTTPAPISPEFRKKIIGDEKPITTRPADALAPELDKLREEVKPWAIQDEDVLSYALFEQVAVKFFEKRKAKMYGLDTENADFANKIHNV